MLRNANLNNLVTADDIMQAAMMVTFKEEEEGRKEKKGEAESSTPAIPLAPAPSEKPESPLVNSSMTFPPQIYDCVTFAL